MRDLMTLHGVIVAIVVPIVGIVTTVVQDLMLAPRKRIRMVTHYDILLIINHGCQP